MLKHWTTQQGLPVNHIKHLAQTGDGYLWIGSFHGLTRFDGTEFVTYSAFNTAGWDGGNVIYQLCTDKEGKLWFRAGGITENAIYTLDKYNQDSHAFARQHFDANPHTMACLEENQISVTFDSTFILIDSERTFKRHVVPGLKAQSNFYAVSRNDTLLYAVEDQLNYVINDQRTTFNLPRRPSSSDNLESQSTISRVAIQEHMMDLLLLAGTDIVDFSNEKFSVIDTLPDSFTQTFIPGSFNVASSLWITLDDHVREYNKTGIIRHALTQFEEQLLGVKKVHSTTDVVHTVWQVSGFESRLLRRKAVNTWEATGLARLGVKSILDIYHDQEGITWIATDFGLVELRERKMKVFTPVEGLVDRFVFSLFEDQSGSIWIGTFGDGLQKLEDNMWTIMNHSTGLPSNLVTYINQASDGTMWIGTYDGITQLKGKNKLREIIFADHEIVNNYTRDMLYDNTGTLWVATSLIFKIKDEKIHKIPVPGSNRQRAIEQLPGGAIIVGNEEGLHEYNRNTQSFDTWPSFSDVFITALTQEKDSILWVSTHGKGLARIKNGKTFHYTTEHGLPSNVILYALDDLNGFLWLGSDNGLIRVSHESMDAVSEGKQKMLNLFVFTEEDGLPSSELISGTQSAIRASDGTLWFATIAGVAVINPKDIAFNTTPPETHIASVFNQGQPVKETNNLRLKSGPQNTVEFHFRTNSLSSSNRRKYKYRLSGLETEWHTVSENRARYTNLNPGAYTFEVMGTNNDGTWSLTPASMSFTILPAFYQTSWFIFLCTMLTLVGIWITYRQFLLRNKLSLARSRIQLADDLHDDIGSRLMAISQSLNFLSSKRSLSDIEMQELERQSNIADALGYELRDHVWLVDANQDSLSHLIIRMEQFLSLLSGSISTRFKGPLSIPEKAINPSWRRNVYFIYKEAVQNALKHAESTDITVVVSVSQGDLFFSVEDNGKGFNQESTSTGRGMSTMKKRAAKVQAKLDIESSINKGTRIIFRGRIV